MQLNQRQQTILNLLQKNGEVTVHELKDRFQVTEMTIRRDLEKMEQAGLVRRVYGGAIPVSGDIALQERTEVMKQEKERIGRAAASLVQAGEAIFIDGGSTTLQVARFLDPGLNLTVVTNALNVAVELLKKKIATIVIGGIVLESTSSMIGPAAIAEIQRMAYDRAFIGATGLNVRHGFSNSNMNEAEVKRTVIRQASEVNIVLDHTKFGARHLFSFASLGEVDRIVTDREPDLSIREACEAEHVVCLTAN